MKLEIDLNHAQRIHVVGIGGPGMSAIAVVLHEMGHVVTGSDIRENAAVQSLRSRGIIVSIGHSVDVVAGVDAVTYSTGVPRDNIEILAASHAGVLVLHRSEMLAAICSLVRSIGVAGTHGKTTTAAMLVHILLAAELRPSYVIGAEVLETSSGASWTGEDVFIVEADESDGTHAALFLRAAIITNIDKDHLDYFGSLDEIRQSFISFADNVEGPVIVCHDDAQVVKMLAEVSLSSREIDFITYGISSQADVVMSNLSLTSASSECDITIDGHTHCISLPTFGGHNLLNAVAALVMAHQFGVAVEVGITALASFGGVERRFQDRGTLNGVALLDDYAHLPAEIAAVIAATKQRFPQRRLLAVFQPNRFHRIAAMAGDYAECFNEADLVAITDVYASGTPQIEGITGELVVQAIQGADADKAVAWCRTRDALVQYVLEELRPGDVCLSMGCGDIEHFPDEILKAHDARKDSQ
ncbi:MAG: UDP-N-acetylmuramate--L-alanine ligase [Ilumatobacteraceae bacterium]|nr:UDP-N-acetylmuramate--L-alanine ligase [Ilumatobacteraceae bacterium]